MFQFPEKYVGFGCMRLFMLAAGCERDVTIGFPPGNDSTSTQETGRDSETVTSEESDSGGGTGSSGDITGAQPVASAAVPPTGESRGAQNRLFRVVCVEKLDRDDS